MPAVPDVVPAAAPVAPAIPMPGAPGRRARPRPLAVASGRRFAVLALLGAVIFLSLTEAGRNVRTLAPAGGGLDGLAGRLGLRLEQVAVTGQRFTSDSDIFDALQIGAGTTILNFDAAAARARIEALPWVSTATIERTLPGGLSIVVAERRPIAVWRMPRSDKRVLIDVSGRVLAAVSEDLGRNLTQVAGDGAPDSIAPLVAALHEHPAVLERLSVAERVGGRRWTLHLAQWPLVHLPETGISSAMAQFEELLHRYDPNALAAVDLRIRGRVGLSPAVAQPRS